MRSGHFFYRATKLVDRQAETKSRYCKGSPFSYPQFLPDDTKPDGTIGPSFEFFRHCAVFRFFCRQRVPFKCFGILQQTEVSKSPKGRPFLVFRHCESVSKFSSYLFRNKFQFFISNFVKCLQRVRLQLLKIFCNNLDFQKVERVPLLQF